MTHGLDITVYTCIAQYLVISGRHINSWILFIDLNEVQSSIQGTDPESSIIQNCWQSLML